MKKLGLLALIVGLIVFGTIGVNAAGVTAEQLKERVLGTFDIGGEKYELTSGDKKIAKDLFAAHTLTDAQATMISGKLDRAVQLAQEQGHVNFKNYPQGVKDELKLMVSEIATEIDVDASLTKDGLRVDGKLITHLVKQTGYETSKTAIIAGISFIIVAVGTCLVIKQVKTSE